MKMYSEDEETARLEFARKAAKHFADHPETVTYGENGPVKGELYALRWGMGNDCVVVFKIDEYAEIVNYQQFIDRDRANIATKLARMVEDNLRNIEAENGKR